MGWIFGNLGRRTDADERTWAARGPAPRHVVRTADTYLAAGGIEATCLAGDFPAHAGAAAGWVVVGLGFRRTNAGFTPLDARAWAARLAAEAPQLADVEGHFVALRYGAGRAEAWTDALGLRTLHVAPTADGVVFGTRLDLVARAAGVGVLDLGALGPHWLAFNAFTSRSLVEGIRRLGPGGRALLTAGSVQATAAAWRPAPTSAAPLAVLADGMRARAVGRGRSLGLSGGLDSRLLLTLLADAGDPFALHVFGAPADPDVHTAERVADAIGAELTCFATDVPDADVCWTRLHAYAAEACATTPASTAVRLGHFEALHDRGYGVIDGGFGEVARRQFFNRLLRARVPLRADAAPDVLPYLRIARANVFTPEALAAMTAGAEAELAAALEALPASGARGDRLDLLAAHVRLPYFFGYEQARLDARVAAYMPYAQPAFLDAVFATPLRLRRNGRLFRRAIRARQPALTRIPLVKGGGRYPFALGTAGAHVYTALRARFVAPYADDARTRFLDRLRDRVLELAGSAGVRHHAPYDAVRVRALVEDYYGGNTARAVEVDWWLAFEAWRRTVTGESW